MLVNYDEYFIRCQIKNLFYIDNVGIVNSSNIFCIFCGYQ